ncbi:MAG: hypothetical protein AAGD07_19210 [Planctomycetota bacterium]
MSDPNLPENPSKTVDAKTQKHESNIEVDIPDGADFSEALEMSVGALKDVLGGIVGMGQDLAGPEGLKTMQATQWISQVSTALESLSTKLTAGDVGAAAKGELSCFLDQIEPQLSETQLKAQIPAFRDRIQRVATSRQQRDPSDQETNASLINEIEERVGYFKASVKRVIPDQPST